MLKNILAIIVGVIAGGAAVAFLELWLSPMLFEVPEMMDPQNPESVSAYLDEIPLGAKSIVVIAQGIGSCVATKVAVHITNGVRKTALLTGAILVFFTSMNLYNIPHPAWMGISMFVLSALGVYIGAKGTD